VRFWNWKFIVALALAALFLLGALNLGLATDPESGESRPLVAWTKRGEASFIFLLVVLYILSHTGGWLLATFLHRGRPHNGGDARKQTKRKRRT